MASSVDILERQVAAAVDLIATLRAKVASLEREIQTMDHGSAAAEFPAPDPSLVAEVERLRSERIVVRESIRGLLREIDRVSW